jgi:16S rRNA (guanine966-N2)-methyltransferase
MLRIVSGEFGGRRIRAPRGRETRPTAERIREAWFSALGQRLLGSHVVDLFAGSGALGLEALSRGAARAHFVESDHRVALTIRGNIQALGVEERASLIVRDVFVYLGGGDRDGRGDWGGKPFDIAFADPPYDTSAVTRLVECFLDKPFARLLCVEHAASQGDFGEGAHWTRRYGQTRLTFLSSDATDPSRELSG